MTEPRTDPSMPAQAQPCAAAIDDYLDRYLQSLDLTDSLGAAVRHALLAGGKRVRPLLAWLSCMAAGAEPERSLPAGAAVELVHAFSLAHDDLPAIDNDDLRRGRPALHVQAGEAGAILAGDAMLTLAVHILSTRVDDPVAAARLAGELSGATAAMITGQVLDLQRTDPRSPGAPEHLARIHRRKTGALIRASCRMGAICAGADDALEHVTAYADAAGLMFQIVDDLLDVEQHAEWIGKTPGADRAAGKLTYPAVHGIDASRREIERLHAAALESVTPLGHRAAPLCDLADYLAARTR